MAFIKLDEATVQALVAETVSKDLFTREFGDLKKRLETQEKKLDKQESLSFQVIVGVLLAAFLVYIATAIQIALYAASNGQE